MNSAEDHTAHAMDEFERIAREAMRMHDGAGSRIGYFAALYHGVTKSMIGPIRFQPGIPGPGEGPFFDDAVRLDAFVGIFAKRYFDAYEQRDTLEPSHPWKLHFDYCDNPHATILQILTSGANAHMVLDLPMAAIATAATSGTPIEELKGDFNRINQVLSWQIQACQQQVLDVSPVLKLVNRIPKLSAWLVRQLIGWARKLAWSNALTVAPDDPPLLGSAVSDAETEQELRDAVGDWARVIARPPLPIHLVLRYLVAPFEKAPVDEIIRHLMTVELSDDLLDELRHPTAFA